MHSTVAQSVGRITRIIILQIDLFTTSSTMKTESKLVASQMKRYSAKSKQIVITEAMKDDEGVL